MKTLYVDCSFLAEHPDHHTGIQRVVRRVMENLHQLAADYPGLRIQAVQLDGGRFDPVEIARLQVPVPGASHKPARWPSRQALLQYLRRVFDSSRDFAAALAGDHPSVRGFLYAPRNRFGLAYLIDRLLLEPLRYLRGQRRISASDTPSALLDEVRPGDMLLLLDSTWNCDIWPSVAAFRARQGRVYSIIYDLIPFSHPQFFSRQLIADFSSWLLNGIPYVDGYIGISHTVELQTRELLASEQPAAAQAKRYGHFLLGADFTGEVTDSHVPRQGLHAALSVRPAYLMVSTVEPRKNHAYLLDAFEQLWARGVDVSLVIVGRTGWKVEALMQRIRNHPEYGRRLQHWSDLNDAELAHCYQTARCLVFPSIVEGFGLPIVESLAHDLPVLASDTPIHREIGGSQIGYFDLARPADLAERIEAIERDGLPDELKVAKGYQWLSWRDSSRQLLERVLAMSEGVSSTQDAGLESVPVSG